MPENDSEFSKILIGFATGGIINTSVLLWLGLQWASFRERLKGIEKDIYYLKREVSYVNGRAEPDEEDGERK